MKKRLEQKGGSYLITVLPLYLFTLIFVIGPLIYVLLISVMTKAENWGIIYEFDFSNYSNIFNSVYLETFTESIKLGLITTCLVALIGYPMGYFMARLSATAKKVCLALIMIPFWTSSLIRLYGWVIIFRANGPLDSLLMFLGITEDPLKLLYTYPAVVTGMVYALLPFMVLSVFSSAEKLDWTLMEASRDLGASSLKAFFTVAFKLTLPGLMSGVILTFIPSMGLYFIAEILGGNKVMLVGNLIEQQLLTYHNWPFAAALAVVLMVLTSLMIFGYKKMTGSDNIEGLI